MVKLLCLVLSRKQAGSTGKSGIDWDCAGSQYLASVPQTPVILDHLAASPPTTESYWFLTHIRNMSPRCDQLAIFIGELAAI